MNYDPAKGGWTVNIQYRDGSGMRTGRASLDSAVQLVVEEDARKPIKQATVEYRTVLDVLIDS